MIDRKARNARIVAPAKALTELAKNDPKKALEQGIEMKLLNPDGSVHRPNFNDPPYTLYSSDDKQFKKNIEEYKKQQQEKNNEE
jgi:hypothetical protein